MKLAVTQGPLLVELISFARLRSCPVHAMISCKDGSFPLFIAASTARRSASASISVSNSVRSIKSFSDYRRDTNLCCPRASTNPSETSRVNASRNVLKLTP